MQMYWDGVEIHCLPETAHCQADEEQRCPLDMGFCPMNESRYVCDPDCHYYSEEPKEVPHEE